MFLFMYIEWNSPIISFVHNCNYHCECDGQGPNRADYKLMFHTVLISLMSTCYTYIGLPINTDKSIIVT